MSYSEIPIPNRSQHLWKYTPWNKIHPTKVDTIPTVQNATIIVDGEIINPNSIRDADTNLEISRTFLKETNNTMHSFVISEDNNCLEIVIDCSNGLNLSHLHFDVEVNSNIQISIVGECDWLGLHITGNLDSNVNCSFAIINQISKNTNLLRCEDWNIARDSSLEYGELSLGGGRVKSDVRTYLNQTNASLKQNVAVMADDDRHDDHHIEIYHKSGHTYSSLNVNSACTDSGHAIGTGLLVIEEDCDGSDAGQVFKNLLLSQKAKAESIPELEVLSDDVSAAHGAASSSVNEEQIHYMMSRGFDREDAKSLIVEGFLISNFSKMSNENTRNFLLNHLKAEESDN